MANIAQVYERNQEATLYIGNCDTQVTEEIVWELFLQCGPVVSVQMPRDKVTGEHNGFGFVEFKSEEDADYAIKIMHMTKLFGKPIKANKASQDKRTQEVGANIWVGNLNEDVDEKNLYDTFSAFGLILSTKVARDPESGESKNHGFVSYDSFDSADIAIKAMNNQYFSNRTIKVTYAFKKESKGEIYGSAAERLLAANRPIMSRPGFFGNQDNSMGSNSRSLILPASLITNHNSHLLSTEGSFLNLEGLNQPSIDPDQVLGNKEGKIQLIKKSAHPSVLTTPQQAPMNSVIPHPQQTHAVPFPKLPPPGMAPMGFLPGLPNFGNLPNLPPLNKLPPLPNLGHLPPLPGLPGLPLPNLPPLPGLGLPSLPNFPGLPPLPGMLPVMPPLMPPPNAQLLGKRRTPSGSESDSDSSGTSSSDSSDSDSSSDPEKKIKDIG